MESLDLVMRNGGSPAEICVRAGIVTEALVQAAAFPFGSHPCLRANARLAGTSPRFRKCRLRTMRAERSTAQHGGDHHEIVGGILGFTTYEVTSIIINVYPSAA
jgi:ribosomal protein L40E